MSAVDVAPGDSIHVRGHTSDFGQRVESLQIGHAPVTEAGPQDDFGDFWTAVATESGQRRYSG